MKVNLELLVKEEVEVMKPMLDKAREIGLKRVSIALILDKEGTLLKSELLGFGRNPRINTVLVKESENFGKSIKDIAVGYWNELIPICIVQREISLSSKEVKEGNKRAEISL